MSMFLDPLGDTGAKHRQLAARIPDVNGRRLGVLDNGKTNADKFLKMVGDILVEKYGVAKVTTVAKEALSKPAPLDVLEQVVPQSDFVITGIGDCGSCSTCCVHDGVEIEKMGVPGIAICTEAFKPGLDALAAMRGMPDYAFAIVPHPLGVLFDDELLLRAELAAPQVVEIATKYDKRPTVNPAKSNIV